LSMDPDLDNLVTGLIHKAKVEYDHGVIDKKTISLAVGIIILDALQEELTCPE
jgi:hypothetical protein